MRSFGHLAVAIAVMLAGCGGEAPIKMNAEAGATGSAGMSDGAGTTGSVGGAAGTAGAGGASGTTNGAPDAGTADAPSAAVEAGPPTSTAAGASSCTPACLTTQPACDVVTKTCRAPTTCDTCVNDADCGDTMSCLALDTTKLCVPRGVGKAACQVGPKCCRVNAQGTIFVSQCLAGSGCTEPGADVSNAGVPGGVRPPLRDLPKCSGCDGDVQCGADLVCGTLPSGKSGFCVPPTGVTQCCLSSGGVGVCLNIGGSVHLPGDGGTD
jgi:hypothetical protein